MTSTYDGLAFGPNSDGAFDFVFSSTADSADNAFSITATYEGTLTGYSNACYVNLTVSGSISGGVSGTQVNAFAADVTLDGSSGAGGYGGLYIYMVAAGSFADTSAVVYGICSQIDTIGQVDYLTNLWLQMHDSNASTGVSAFILMSGQGNEGGKNSDMIYYQGITKPPYVLHFQDATVNGCYSDSVVGEASNSDGALKVKIGDSVFQIPLYAAT